MLPWSENTYNFDCVTWRHTIFHDVIHCHVTSHKIPQLVCTIIQCVYNTVLLVTTMSCLINYTHSHINLTFLTFDTCCRVEWCVFYFACLLIVSDELFVVMEYLISNQLLVLMPAWCYCTLSIYPHIILYLGEDGKVWNSSFLCFMA